ncbi:hypothetical protein DHEL01_v202132 [Diaporthe helianthi]|uniref:DUF7704 domain-containing protein n=1 Tax=Diaporthe helianthi TaxID=158607 RepID=A0A2P5IAE6_DIAHE|nr:hypothetical protein DHEL01_v202132 [Diaporthe helianthi]
MEKRGALPEPANKAAGDGDGDGPVVLVMAPGPAQVDDYLFLVSPVASAHYHPSMQIVLDQLAAAYFLFAFNQTVVLRIDGNDDVRVCVWSAMICGMLLFDLLHFNAAGNSQGWGILLDPEAWRFEEWLIMIPTCGVAAARVAFLLGFGVAGEEPKPKMKTGVLYPCCNVGEDIVSVLENFASQVV